MRRLVLGLVLLVTACSKTADIVITNGRLWTGLSSGLVSLRGLVGGSKIDIFGASVAAAAIPVMDASIATNSMALIFSATYVTTN